MVKTPANPGGLPKEVFDGFQAQTGSKPSPVLLRCGGWTVLWLQPAWCETLTGG